MKQILQHFYNMRHVILTFSLLSRLEIQLNCFLNFCRISNDLFEEKFESPDFPLKHRAAGGRELLETIQVIRRNQIYISSFNVSTDTTVILKD